MNAFLDSTYETVAAPERLDSTGRDRNHTNYQPGSAELLTHLGAPIPGLPPYDPDKDPPFPWEAEVRAAIERLKAEKLADAESAGPDAIR